MKVTQAAAAEDCSVAGLATIIEQDAGLSALVLRAVNSAYYAPRVKLASASRAVSFLGVEAVRNLVLSVAARGMFAIPASFPVETFWERSLSRAAAARGLCELLGRPRADEFFTMGLCQDIGILVQIQQAPGGADALGAAIDEPADLRWAGERQTLEGHDIVGARMLVEWGLPDVFTAPILFHHKPDEAPEEHRFRAELLGAAEALSDLSARPTTRGLQIARKQVEALGAEPQALGRLVERVNEIVELSSDVLDIRVGRRPSLEEIVATATEGLLALNLSYQELTTQLRQTLSAQQQMAEELRRVNDQLKELASTDPLTGLANRRAFDDALARELAQARRQKHPLSLLMLDIDHFKKFNDSYGHDTGDSVLVAVAQAMANALRSSDLAARYGGEEFCAILPATPLAGAQIAGERVRAAIEALRLPWRESELRVTASVGCAEVRDLGAQRAATVTLRSADDALYAAKEAGRNRVMTAS